MENSEQGKFLTARKSRLATSMTTMGKIPPQSVDLEEAVLGGLMLEKDALFIIGQGLKAEVFYTEAHKKIFEAILSLFQKSQPIDILTVTAEMRQKGTLEMVGGAYYITNLTNRVASAANIEYHATIIKQKFLQREMIRICTEGIGYAYEDTTDVFDLFENVSSELFKQISHNIGKQAQKFSAIFIERLKEYQKPSVNGLTGMGTGFSSVDRITHGWQKTHLVIIAARPSMGKTAFVLNTAKHAATNLNKPVAIFSLEMSSVQLVDRMVSCETEIQLEKIKQGNLADWEWQKISHANALIDSAIYIDDTPALSIIEFRAKARRLKSQFDIQMIIVDYLQLMKGEAEGKGTIREQEIGSISRGLKAVAKELDIPVLALSQLSRAVESRPGPNGKRPLLSDLRESGSIEQDADMVGFLFRPEYYGIIEDEQGRSLSGVTELIFAKNRDGELDTALLSFKGSIMKFSDLDNLYTQPPEQSPPTAMQANLDFDKNQEIIIRPSKITDKDDDTPF